jgi:Cysteine-rich secretory protein family
MISAPADGSVSYVNSVRAANGMPALQYNARLAATAQAWAEEMARTGVLQHNPNLASQVGAYKAAAENIGYGPTEEWVNDGLKNSPSHLKNILDPRWTQMGSGVATSADGRVWVSDVFLQPASAPAPPPPPAPAPTRTAAVKPRPVPPPPAPAPPTPPVTPPPPTTTPTPTPVSTREPQPLPERAVERQRPDTPEEPVIPAPAYPVGFTLLALMGEWYRLILLRNGIY